MNVVNDILALDVTEVEDGCVISAVCVALVLDDKTPVSPLLLFCCICVKM